MNPRTFVLAVAVALASVGAARAERWSGVDDTVVEKVAAEAGRHARPLVTMEGDLLLFAFLSAGILGGFALGYGYRALFVERRPGSDGR